MHLQVIEMLRDFSIFNFAVTPVSGIGALYFAYRSIFFKNTLKLVLANLTVLTVGHEDMISLKSTYCLPKRVSGIPLVAEV